MKKSKWLIIVSMCLMTGLLMRCSLDIVAGSVEDSELFTVVQSGVKFENMKERSVQQSRATFERNGKIYTFVGTYFYFEQ